MTYVTTDKPLLIVEDDDALRTRLETAMRKRGFRCISAATLDEARAAMAADPPGYAVVDLHLHDGSGLEVIDALKRDHSGARAIVLTGYGNTATAVAAVKLGAVDYLAKPATADEITDALMHTEGLHPPAPVKPIPPAEAQRAHIERFLHRTDANITKTARLLNMHRRTLQRILRRGRSARS
ncbi:response regulator transcription factor [Roseovarius sp. SYSU LYC5161]|uniref:response regulator transcription factor n=1 Tax=Roseovarius halophilus (ex Wu et al. 2025) TaxID=3376060 RepID=UPI00399A521C